jgi:hypothetical protein
VEMLHIDTVKGGHPPVTLPQRDFV